MKNVHNCQITTCLMFCQFQRDGVAYNSAAYKKTLILEIIGKFVAIWNLCKTTKYMKISETFIKGSLWRIFHPVFQEIFQKFSKKFFFRVLHLWGVGRAGFWDKNYYLHKRKYTKSFFSMFSILVRIRRFAGNCR